MAYALEIVKPGVEKHALVIMRPRVRVTGWTLFEGTTTWVADFDKGPVSMCWRKQGVEELPVLTAYTHGGSGVYFDEANGKLYAHWGTTSPDDEAYAELSETMLGFTVEYELYIATKEFMGPRDPMDASSAHRLWRGVLERSPETSHGARESLFGFNPMVTSSLQLNNRDGWLLPHLHETSWNLAEVAAYVMCGSDLDLAVTRSDVKQVFLGYAGQPAVDVDGLATIPTSDFAAFLERDCEPAERYSTAEFPNVEPSAVKTGEEWWIRRVRGMVDNFRPVNIDYNATPSTTDNRDFATHEDEGTQGTWGATVDHTGTNDATTTTMLTTPQCNVGDSIIIQRSGVDKYAFVTAVNRATKQITHSSITGSASALDQVIRYYVGWVKVRDSDGNWWNLGAGRSYSRIGTITLGNNPAWLGFRLIDNWEGDVGFPETFDPSKHEVVCRVYGTEDLDTYSDASTVGSVTDEGGNNAKAKELLYYLLRAAGIAKAQLDKTSFEALSTNHALGLAIPQSRSTYAAPTYRELIGLVLQSMMWKLGYVDMSGEIGIGVIETGPFVASADYEIDQSDFSAFSFEHDYSDLKGRVKLAFQQKEMFREEDPEIFSPLEFDGQRYATYTNPVAKELHLSTDLFELEILQYVRTEAELMARRYAFALGDRRGYYGVRLGAGFLDSSSLGASYQIKRQQLPGYENVVDTIRERQTSLIEVQKAARGVNLTLEDQKGIQDNSGDWT